MAKNLFIVMFLAPMEIVSIAGGDSMQRRKSNHVIPGANTAKAQGAGAGYNEEMANEPLTIKEKMNNKKRKNNQ